MFEIVSFGAEQQQYPKVCIRNVIKCVTTRYLVYCFPVSTLNQEHNKNLIIIYERVFSWKVRRFVLKCKNLKMSFKI